MGGGKRSERKDPYLSGYKSPSFAAPSPSFTSQYLSHCLLSFLLGRSDIHQMQAFATLLRFHPLVPRDAGSVRNRCPKLHGAPRVGPGKITARPIRPRSPCSSSTWELPIGHTDTFDGGNDGVEVNDDSQPHVSLEPGWE
ncbi:hypothetical protein H6P81_001187 [Aristolochia fimbriata]|uniref:Uncharacterized protein n=1 Tax=Aristolochia fimbriata TaxID=158543 RepID=A0AAV7F7N9_ARIFI|nr:hypothetical protein H6P81_001187 [Aristolochia fimbriata]